MVSQSDRPKARPGLLVSEHEKAGRTYIVVLDPQVGEVVLLEPWEHAVLTLADGVSEPEKITASIVQAWEKVTDFDVRRCLRFLGEKKLVESCGAPSLVQLELGTMGPQTYVGFQKAYQEWHKERPRTVVTGDTAVPYPEVPKVLPADLEPTVATLSRPEVTAHEPQAYDWRVATVVGQKAEGESFEAMSRAVIEQLPGDGELAELQAHLDVPSLLAAVDKDLSDNRSSYVSMSTQSQSGFGAAGLAPTIVGRVVEASDGALAYITSTSVPAGFSSLQTAAFQAQEGGEELSEQLKDLPKADLDELVEHFRALRKAHSEVSSLDILIRLLDGVAEGRAISADFPKDGAFSEVVRSLVKLGRCPRCAEFAHTQFTSCSHCGFTERA